MFPCQHCSIHANSNKHKASGGKYNYSWCLVCWPCVLACVCLFIPYKHLYFCCLSRWNKKVGYFRPLSSSSLKIEWGRSFLLSSELRIVSPCSIEVLFSSHHLQIPGYSFRTMFSHNYSSWLVASDAFLIFILFQWCYGSRRETRKHLCSREVCGNCESYFQNRPYLVFLMCSLWISRIAKLVWLIKNGLPFLSWRQGDRWCLRAKYLT